MVAQKSRWASIFAALAAISLADGARAEATPEPAPTETPAPKSAIDRLDELYQRLAKTADPEEAAGIVNAIERRHLQSGSDTADLLMSRAMFAISKGEADTALLVLNELVVLEPDWAEAWNKRATVRFMTGDLNGSMADVAQTLRREPRHLGALSGMGMILEQDGQLDDALAVFEKAHELAPAWEPVKASIQRVKAAIAAHSL